MQTQEICRIWEDQRGDRQTRARTVLITGPAGVGKTQLAVSVFEDHARKTDLRLWVSADSRASVVAALAQAMDRVQAPVSENADTDQKAVAFLDWLSVTERSWLVVFDNVSDPAQLAGLWPAGAGRVLATTYRQDAGLIIGSGITTVRLGVFTAQEAQAYVERRILNSSEVGMQTAEDVLDEADGLARDLGYLPVALAQAVSVILYQVIRCSDYRADFADRANRLSELFPERLPPDEYERTVATTWSLAMEQANALPPMGLADPMIQLASVVDPAGAPEALFLAEPALIFLSAAVIPKNPDRTASSSLSASTARAVLRSLHSLSLIEHQPGSQATVRIHGLTQRAVRESIPVREFDDAVVVVADSLNVVWTTIERDGLALLLANTGHLIASTANALWNDRPHGVLSRAGLSMLDAGMVTDSIRHFEWLKDQITKRLEPDAPEALASRNSLARAYQAAGKLTRAIELYEQNLTARERILGKEHPETMGSRNNLATAYQDVGKLTRAIELFEQTLTDSETFLGKDHLDTLGSRNNLAGAYQDNGNLPRAIQLYEQTLADSERIRGRDHPKTLITCNNLASAYWDQGNVARAIELLEQALSTAERVLGEDHPDTLACRNNLANLYKGAGDRPRAIQLLEDNLTNRERVLGNIHPHTLASRNNLAGAYHENGDLPRAIKLYEQTLTDRERVLGKDHPDTLISRDNLAMAYQQAGDLPQAIQLLEQNLTHWERVRGKDHPHTMLSRDNLATGHLRGGNLSRAISLLEQNLTESECRIANDHPDTLTYRNNLATGYQIAGVLPRAIELFERNLVETERILGKFHPVTVTHRNNLVDAKREADDPGDAIH